MAVRKIVIPELEQLPDINPRAWTLDERTILVTYYGKKDIDAICKYLKKSRAGVRTQAYDLGIGYKSTDEERQEIIRRLIEEDGRE